jgi:hypothetical protein
MSLITRTILINSRGFSIEIPDECPICHRYSEIVIQAQDMVQRGNAIQVVCRCAYQECRSFFICYYGPLSPQQPGNVPVKLLSVRPQKPSPTAFSGTIRNLSPTFIAIFDEAEEAKHLGLVQIAGPGFRKAFEFLIKDYGKSLASGRNEEIEKAFSGKVVDDFISDRRIQDVAKRCLWLGNDETHYLRKWTEHNVHDLEVLIKLATNWIEIEQLSKEYIQQMPDAHVKG